MELILVYDEYDQRWQIFEDDLLYEKVKSDWDLEVAKGNENPKLVYPIKYLTEHRGWGWWTVWAALDQIELSLEQHMPNPSKIALIEEREYTPTELQDLLQKLGGHLATLHTLLGKNYATAHSLKEGFKGAIRVGMVDMETKETTIAGKEAELMAHSELLRQTKRIEIQSEASISLLKGWVDAYETAWQTISRIITLRMGEASLSTGRHA